MTEFNLELFIYLTTGGIIGATITAAWHQLRINDMKAHIAGLEFLCGDRLETIKKLHGAIKTDEQLERAREAVKNG